MPATASTVHKALGRAASLADDVKKHGDAVLFRAFSIFFIHPAAGVFIFFWQTAHRLFSERVPRQWKRPMKFRRF